MSSLPDTLDLSAFQPVQETTGGKSLDPDALLSFRAMFLLLDAWDRKDQRSDSDLIRADSGTS